jgi:hypothetical protein
MQSAYRQRSAAQNLSAAEMSCGICTPAVRKPLIRKGRIAGPPQSARAVTPNLR